MPPVDSIEPNPPHHSYGIHVWNQVLQLFCIIYLALAAQIVLFSTANLVCTLMYLAGINVEFSNVH